MMPEIVLLEHVVNHNRIRANPETKGRIQEANSPTSKHEVCDFVGIASYYWIFIPGFAKVARPLHERKSANTHLLLNNAMQKSFEEIKSALCIPPAMAYPGFNNQFIVAIDASNKAEGAVLSQKESDGRYHPIQYASRCLNDAKQNSSMFEREALSMFSALKKLRPYLLSERFILYTNHQASRYVLNHHHPHRRIVRRMRVMEEYDFDIQYKPGKDNSPTDYLPRTAESSDFILTLHMRPKLQHVAQCLKRPRLLSQEDKRVMKGTKF